MKRKPIFVLIPVALFFAVGGTVMYMTDEERQQFKEEWKNRCQNK